MGVLWHWRRQRAPPETSSGKERQSGDQRLTAGEHGDRGISAFSVQRLPATSSPRRKAVQFLCLGRENRFIGNAGAGNFNHETDERNESRKQEICNRRWTLINANRSSWIYLRLFAFICGSDLFSIFFVPFVCFVVNLPAFGATNQRRPSLQ
jgi:hypothetical protein